MYLIPWAGGGGEESWRGTILTLIISAYLKGVSLLAFIMPSSAFFEKCVLKSASYFSKKEKKNK